MIIPITNRSKNFYAHMGRIFGSREVEGETGDRFYDDDSKVWHLYYHKGIPDSFVSVDKGVIKNVWADSSDHLVAVLKEIRPSVSESIVPILFEDEYRKAGYEIIPNGTKNFMKIRGGKDD